MASRNASPEQAAARRQRGRSNLTWILVTLTFLIVIAAPTMIVLFFGMLPTLVAYIIDRSEQKSATFCVGSINFIGVFPYIMDLWVKNNGIDAALNDVTDLFAMLIMYSSAAFGWLLFMAMPTVVASFVTVIQQRKVAQLRAQQKELIEEWGAEVAALVEMQRTEQREHHLEDGIFDLSDDEE
ncbi:MAG TPA: acyl-CoA synthetase [Magnetovibrio sp.]